MGATVRVKERNRERQTVNKTTKLNQKNSYCAGEKKKLFHLNFIDDFVFFPTNIRVPDIRVQRPFLYRSLYDFSSILFVLDLTPAASQAGSK